jgi:hypothetical protein
MPKLTEYLLKLATDAEELKKYRTLRSKQELKELDDYLTEHKEGPGLSLEHAGIIRGHDSRRVVEAVLKELADESSRPENPFYGISISIMCEVNNYVHYPTNVG